MDQERFDNIARKLVSGADRRKILGGAIAGLFGASVATVAGLDAKKKGKKRKGKAKGKKGRVGKASTCSAGDQLECGALTACCLPTDDPAISCVTFAEQNTIALARDGGVCGNSGDVCFTCPPGTYCDGADGARFCNCDDQSCGEGNCCSSGGEFGFQCIANGSGTRADDGEFYCGVDGGEVGGGVDTCNECSFSGGLLSGCCTSDGFCNSGTTGANCGTGGNACATCEDGSECGLDQTCTGDTPPVCPVGFEDCNGACVNLGTSPSNCGACGNVCPGCGKRSKTQCEGGTCGCSQKRKKRKKRRRKK